MTQVNQKSTTCKPPASPKQAARKRAPVDRHLNAELFKALADPTRLKLLACLVKCGRGCTTTEVAECCSVDFSVVSRHLGVLVRAGVLESEKQGRTVWYRPKTKRLADTFHAMGDAVAEWDTGCCEDGCCG